MPAINAVLFDGRQGLWLGSEGALLNWRVGGDSQTYPVKAAITSLARGPDGLLWVGMDEGGGLAQLEDGAVKPFVTPSFDGSKLSVTAMIVDRNSNLWVATDAKGIYRIHGKTVEHYGRVEGLSGDSAWALFEDREGIVWAGTTSGIDSFRDPIVVTFSSVEGLGKDLAAGILASRDGTIWVANSGSLDSIKNGTVSSLGKSKGLPGDQVTSLLEDRDGNLWVGVDDGLFLFKDGRFRRLPEPDRQPLGMVVGITEDIEGNIWASCASRPRKLVRIKDFKVQEVFPSTQLPPAPRLAPNPTGGIWMASPDEVLLLRNGVVESKVSLGQASSPLHRQIMVQADSSVLVGTENGLVGLRKGKLQRMTTKNGLPCDFIIAFTKNKENRWWLYTRCGVVEFTDSELQKWWTNPNAILQHRVYDTFDGAQPNIGSFNAAATTPDGRVWFSSGVVVQMVDPYLIPQQSQLAAAPKIESITVDRKALQPSGKLTVGPRPRDLQIDYTSPTLLVPQNVKFRYRLDGFDRDWHEAGTRRQAFYTDLPPGNYSFRVIASNADGIWNETAAKLDFYVTPAYYQTNWFRALCAMFLFAMIWAGYQLRIRRLHRQFELTLNARVGERTRIARELHDTLLQSFHGLLLRFQTVSHLLPERPVEAKEKLDGTITQAAAAITEGRDAVQALRDSTVQGNDLALAIGTLGDELATSTLTGKEVKFRVTVEGEARELHPIVRDEVYKIAAESLRNAYKHAEARQIEVEIRYDGEQFRLRIRDDGKGIKQEILASPRTEGHFGLHGIEERAKLIGGKLTIWSEVAAGTELELQLPAKAAYAAGRKGSWLSRKLAAKA